MERLKQAKQGYAVSLITKDGKATKMYFVPTAYGYAQGSLQRTLQAIWPMRWNNQ